MLSLAIAAPLLPTPVDNGNGNDNNGDEHASDGADHSWVLEFVNLAPPVPSL
jgi:hypothetical protein